MEDYKKAVAATKEDPRQETGSKHKTAHESEIARMLSANNLCNPLAIYNRERGKKPTSLTQSEEKLSSMPTTAYNLKG